MSPPDSNSQDCVKCREVVRMSVDPRKNPHNEQYTDSLKYALRRTEDEGYHVIEMKYPESGTSFHVGACMRHEPREGTRV